MKNKTNNNKKIENIKSSESSTYITNENISKWFGIILYTKVSFNCKPYPNGHKFETKQKIGFNDEIEYQTTINTHTFPSNFHNKWNNFDYFRWIKTNKKTIFFIETKNKILFRLW